MKKRAEMRKLLRLARGERGQELVEYGLTGVILLFVMFGAFEFAHALYVFHYTSYAAQQGARYAMVRGQTWSKFQTVSCGTSAPPNFTLTWDCTASASDVQNYIQSLATAGINSSNVTVTTTWPGSSPCSLGSGCPSCTTANSQGCWVKVKVQYTFQFLPYPGLGTLPMSATAQKVVVQ